MFVLLTYLLTLTSPPTQYRLSGRHAQSISSNGKTHAFQHWQTISKNVSAEWV